MDGSRCPANFRLRTLRLSPLEEIEYRRKDWADTFVIVERGSLEVECCGGTRAWFGEGAMLAFADLNLRLLRNTGSGQLVLRALSRIRPDE